MKSTPSKDAKTTEKLSVKSGFLLKKNEQGSWQKRFICLVPHTFLYYFEGENADTPRGVIDMELLTQCTVEENHVLKLSTQSENALRFKNYIITIC